MALDLPTTYFIFALVQILITLLYLLSYAYNRAEFAGLKWLLSGSVSLFLVMVLQLAAELRGTESLELPVATLFLAVPLLYYRGIAQLYGIRTAKLRSDIIVLASVIAATPAVFLLGAGFAVSRSIILGSLIAFNLRLSVTLLANGRGRFANPATMAGIGYALMVGADVVRFVTSIVAAGQSLSLGETKANIWIGLIQVMLHVVLAAVVLLMINQVIRDKQQRLIEEKALLNREIHHRVKNSLAVVRSILDIQRATMPDRDDQLPVRDAANRVSAIARLYDALHTTASISSVSSHSYLRGILRGLDHSLGLSDGGITLESDIAEFELTTDQALRVGLLVNEVVTNSAKHAFPTHSGEDRISVALSLSCEDDVVMTIGDNGVGGVGHDRELDSFGVSLIDLLAGQLRGHHEVDDAHGTHHSFRFPLETTRSR